ncbi:MAG: hypothetical protein C0179_04830 [Fervidicoccus sp.]|nr:MAG: hypothetical protein C0179_04830 [Fervidicoccus sp.]
MIQGYPEKKIIYSLTKVIPMNQKIFWEGDPLRRRIFQKNKYFRKIFLAQSKNFSAKNFSWGFLA